MDKIEIFRNYLLKKPTDRFAMYSLALAYKGAGQVDEAEAAFQALLQAHPHSGAGHYQLGTLYREAERFDEALDAWRQGLAALADATDAEARRSVSEITAAIDDLEDEVDDR